MDEAAGATSVAAAVGGTAINLTGATAGAAGQTDGTSVSFNGTSNYGVTASALNLSAQNKIVVEALINYTYTGAGAMAWESTSNLNAATTGFGLFTVDSSALTNSTVILKGDVGHNYGYTTRPTAGDWHHVVAVYNKGLATDEVSIYIDGVLRTISSRPLNNNNANTFGTDLFYLMSRGGGSLFTQGKMQHLAIYSDLSATQIAAHTVASGVSYVVRPADLWENGYDNSSTPRQSNLSRLVFTTNASSIIVNGSSNIVTSYPEFSHLGVRINGVNQSALVFSSGDGTQSFPVTLGSLGVTKTVEVIAGMQTIPSATVLGSFIESITYPNTATFSVSAPTVGNRIVVYGDSIASGGNATNPEYEGIVPLLRNTYNRRVMLEGWGRRSLYDDANSSGLRASFVSRIASYTPSTVWIAMGTNDYGLNKWSAASFGTAYAATLDALHAALPSAKIVCQTPITRTTETANGSGSTLGDYRTQISTICNARAWTLLVDGTALLTTSDLAEGLHPTTAGQAKYAQAANAILTAPTLTTAAASSVTVDAATLNGTIDAVGSTTPTVRGFQYGLTDSYGTTVPELGSFSAGSFSAAITGLPEATEYHVRAYATNYFGTAYGSDETFTTGSTPVSGGGGSSHRNRSGRNKTPVPAADTVPVVSPTFPIVVNTTPAASASSFTQDLYLGKVLPEVLLLQKYLNNHGYAVSVTGAGSSGNETTMFGRATKAALIRLQAAQGIVPAVGYFGPVTRGFVNAH